VLSILDKQTRPKVYSVQPSIKKADTLLDNPLACQLAVIPGVSWEMAKEIAKEYTCIHDFCTRADLAISQIKIKNRKLGDKRAEKILQFCKGVHD
jgi:hypothetical protein